MITFLTDKDFNHSGTATVIDLRAFARSGLKQQSDPDSDSTAITEPATAQTPKETSALSLPPP